MDTIPLVSHQDTRSVFAYRGGQPILLGEFLGDVARLAQQLPHKRHILNLCTDRYRFAVGFAAALLRGQVSLLPPNYTPSFVQRLRQSHPDLYCLADDEVAFQSLEVVQFPQATNVEQTPTDIPRVAASQCAALVFTSGSTGLPVAHPKSWGSLCKGARAEADALGITADSGLAVFGTVPAQHMYGLESCMLIAMQNGLRLVAERPFYPADIRAQLRSLPQPRCLVTTPVHLRTLLAEVAELPAVDFVLCATALLAPQLAQEAEARFGAPLYEILRLHRIGHGGEPPHHQGPAWHLLRGVEMRQDEQGCHVSWRTCRDRGADERRDRAGSGWHLPAARPHRGSGEHRGQAHLAGQLEPSAERDPGRAGRRVLHAGRGATAR